MKTITATEARKRLSSLIKAVESESITIIKKNKPIAVLMSSARYHELIRLEDMLYVKMAELANQEASKPLKI